MKNVIALALLLVLTGCVSQTTPTSNATNYTATNPNASATAPPAHSAGNFSFSRNASDVLNTETRFPEAPKYDFLNITTMDGRLIVYYFYLPYCSACKALRPEIDELEAAYPGVMWQEYDISTANGSTAYRTFADQHNLSTQQRMVPQALVNGTIITDRFHINDSLEGIILNFTSSGGQS